MRQTKNQERKNCKAFRQLPIFFLILGFTSSFGQVVAKDLKLSQLCLQPKVEASRAPANFTPSDDLGFIPLVQEIELKADERLKDDRSGTLKGMKDRLDSWENTREYAETWNLESTGMFYLADEGDRKSLVEKGALRYLDRRLSGEIKSAKRGSAMASVRTLEQTLKPDTSVAVSDNVKIRFTGRLIQRYAKIIVKNPYVKAEGTISMDGNIDLKLSKDFESIDVVTAVNYDVDAGRYVASVDKKITDRWSARVSSEQEDSEIPFDRDLTTYQVFYGFSF